MGKHLKDNLEGAELRGYDQGKMAASQLEDNPYPNQLTHVGGVTFSPAFHKAWRAGFLRGRKEVEDLKKAMKALRRRTAKEKGEVAHAG